MREVLPEVNWEGDGPEIFTGVAGLDEAEPGELSFLTGLKYARLLESTAAAGVFVPEDFAGTPRPGQWLVRVKHPSLALALVCERIEKTLRPRPAAGIHPSAVIDPAAVIDPSATVGPLCVIGAGAEIGARTVLEAQVFVGPGARLGEDGWIAPQVSIHRSCEVGKRVILHSGVVLGGDGFGFEPTPEGHRKIPQIGTVIIEDDVEIGAGSTVDRGRLSPTRVGRGTKIDNLVQIGHNVIIGQHCFLCSLVGIAGSSQLGDEVVLAGQVGVSGHLKIGHRVRAGGQAGIAKSLPDGIVVTGSPANEFQKQRRIEALCRRLPSVFDRLAGIEEKLGAK